MDTIQITQEIRELRKMTVGELRSKYLEAFGEPNRSRNRDYLIRRIAWRIQANAEGGITERARIRAEELANESDIRVRFSQEKETIPSKLNQVTTRIQTKRDPRLPQPGSILTRDYRGQSICVEVGETTFRFEDREYRTLSSIAKEVTGGHWNGFRFFGLGGADK